MGFRRSLLSCLGLVLLVLLFSFSEGGGILVGGNDNSWKIPSSPDDLNKWAAKERFQIGDNLVFKYNATTDSVLQVSGEAYASCRIENPIDAYQNSNTEIKLKKQGPYFFISGIKANCEKGQKLEVVVLSPNHASRGHHHSWTPSPAPSPSDMAPATAPASEGHGLRHGYFTGGVLVFGGLVGLVLV